MIWPQAVFALIVGLVVASAQIAGAKDVLALKGSNSTAGKPGNKTSLLMAPLADNYLYTLFACRNKQNGLRLPIAGSCVDYFECHQGKTLRKTCEEGFQFSNHGLACLDSRISKCRPEQMDIACEGPCCTREDGLYSAEDSCSNFYICISGHTYHRTCGNVLQFDALNLICDIPERARCGAKVEKEVEKVESGDVAKGEEAAASSGPVMYMISHRVCQSKPDGYSVPIPGSCNKFYMCVAGLGYLKSCGRMQFNPAKHYCDLRTRMYCPDDDEDEVILDDDEDLLTEAEPLVEKEQGLDGKKPKPIPGEKNVSLESVEEEEKPKVGKQPPKRPQLPEEIVDPEEDQLGEPVRPGARPSYPKPSEQDKDIAASATQANVCADQPVGALMPLAGECAKYIRCRWDWYERRTAEVLTCPDGMHFNPKTKYCDWLENVNCVAGRGVQKAKKTKKPQKAL